MTKTQLVYDSANDGSIDGARLADGSVSNDKLESGIDGAKLVDDSVSNDKLESGIDGAKLTDGTVSTSKISGDIPSSSISFSQFGSGAIEQSVQAKLRGLVSVLDFIPESEHEAIRDGTTTYDATNDVQAALDSALSVFFPSGRYLVSTIRPRRDSTLIGAGSSSTIVGTVILGDENLVDSSIRGITLLNLNFQLPNPLSPDYPVKIYLSPDFVIFQCSCRGIFIDFSVRGLIKDCKLRRSNGWAIYGQGYVNGIIIKDNVITGGTAGGAINLRGPVTVGNISGNIIESSRDGIWISSEPQGSGPGLTAGNSNALTVTGNYLEQVRTPFRIGEVFSVLSSNISENYIGNSQQSVISERTTSYKFGRLKDCKVTNNRAALAADGTENFMEFVVNLTGNLFGNTIKNNRWDEPANNVLLLSGSFASNPTTLRGIGGTNYIDITPSGSTNRVGSEEYRTYVSREFKANETVSSLSWLSPALLEFGGKVYGINIIEAVGSLSGCRLRIGDTSDFAKMVDINDLSTLSFSGGFSDLAVTGDVYSTEDNIINITAGAGSGSFRLQFFYRAL